jgi:cytosine/adenosine deaminase-related metal-dependent hydrolase
MAAHQRPDEAFAMVSDEARRALGLPMVDLHVGAVADLVAVESTSIREAVAEAPAARRVFRGGREVAVTTASRRILRPGVASR